VFYTLFSIISGFLLAGMEDKQKIHKLLEDARTAANQCATLDSVCVALPGLSFSARAQAKIFATVRKPGFHMSEGTAQSEASSASSSNFGKRIFVGFRFSQIKQAEEKQTSSHSDPGLDSLNMEVTQWDSVSQVAERAALNSRKRALKRRPLADEHGSV